MTPRTALVGFVAILGLAHLAQVAVAQENPPKQKVGNWWVLKDPNTSQIVEVISVVAVADNGDFTVVDEQGVKSVYTAEFNKRQLGANTYNPHNYNFAFPLTPGKSWNGVAGASGPGGIGSFSIKGRVAGIEEITLNLLGGKPQVVSAVRVESTFRVMNWPMPVTCWVVPGQVPGTKTLMQFPAKCTSPDGSYRAREVVAWGTAEDPKPH